MIILKGHERIWPAESLAKPPRAGLIAASSFAHRHCWAFPRSGVPWNESDYSNPDFDQFLTEAEGLLDLDQRREVLANIERLMQEDGPIVQPLWRKVFSFWDKRVKGFQKHPSLYLFANEWAIET